MTVDTNAIMAAQAEPARTGRDGSGFDEQWLRQLEKAYFEKQVELMRSTAGTVRQDAVPVLPAPPRIAAQAPAALATFSPGADAVPRAAANVAADSRAGAPRQNRGAAAAAVNAAPTGGAGIRAADLPAFHGGQRSARTAASPAVARMPAQFHGALPALNSMTPLLGAHGIHLVIRDATLDRTQLLALLDQLRTWVEAGNQQLAAVTLNGELVWLDPARTNAAADPSGDGPAIDKLF